MNIPRLSLSDELKRFRDFALRGSVVDLAFAVRRREVAPAPAAPPCEEVLLTESRDLLAMRA